MAVVDYFSNEPKSGPNFTRTEATLPRITGVFTARKDGYLIPFEGSNDIQQKFFETVPVENERSREMQNRPWPRVEFAFECKRTLSNSAASISGVRPSSTNRAANDNSNVVYIEPRFKSAGGLVSIERDHFHVQNIPGKSSYKPIQNPESCYGNENMGAELERSSEFSGPNDQYSSSCFSDYDRLKKSIPCRSDLHNDPLKKLLNSTFYETIELYKTAIQCGLNIHPYSPLPTPQGSTKPPLAFSWEEIKSVLENDATAHVQPTLLADVIDLNALTLMLNRKSYVNSSIKGRTLSPSNGWSYSSNQNVYSSNSSVDGEVCMSSDSCLPKGSSTQTKNVISIPYVETHMEAILRSSSAQMHSHGAKAENQSERRGQLASNVSACHSNDFKEKGDGFYLGRYPCLRDVSYATTKDELDGRNSPILMSDDSSEKSPEIIIRPRPPSENYGPDFGYDQEDFQSSDHFPHHQTASEPFDPPFPSNSESMRTPTCATNRILSLPPSDALQLNENSRNSDSTPLSMVLANVSGYRPIAPKTEEDVPLLNKTSNGEALHFYIFIISYFTSHTLLIYIRVFK